MESTTSIVMPPMESNSIVIPPKPLSLEQMALKISILEERVKSLQNNINILKDEDNINKKNITIIQSNASEHVESLYSIRAELLDKIYEDKIIKQPC